MDDSLMPPALAPHLKAGDLNAILAMLGRITDAVERMVPNEQRPLDIHAADAFVWDGGTGHLAPVKSSTCVGLELLQGLDEAAQRLLTNTRYFAQGLPANNALIWGARGTGKSSLVKAVHRAIATRFPGVLALIEISREDIGSLPRLLARLRGLPRRFVLFCDDLSFDRGDVSYKALKSVLDGGIEGRPDNAVLYVTSNRRHLVARSMVENEQSTALMAGEAVEENVSLSDRFGLWIGFHNMDQATYLRAIDGYVRHYELPIGIADVHAQALEWAAARGARSGRVAWQFIQDLAGRLGCKLV
jgi:predicted AAA+ superfamily ATPase